MKNKNILILLGLALLLQPVFLLAQGFPGGQGGFGGGQGGFGGAQGGMSGAFAEMEKAFAASEPATIEDEYFLGRAVAANILDNYKPYTRNQDLTTYLNRILQALVINSPRPEIFNGYHLMILDTAEFNAFASPGGHIFITRGLVEAAPSEDAIAAIIAHEIAHIYHQHAMSIIDDMKLTEMAGNAAQQAAALQNSPSAQRALALRNSVSGIMDTMMKSGFSKPQEFEADSTALKILADTRYDPNGLLEMLRILGNVQRRQNGGFNSTHPTPAERIEKVQPLVRQYRVPDTKASRAPRFKNK